MDSKMRGADIVVRSLIAEQAELIFGEPGGAIMPVYDARYDYHDQIKHVLTRHEKEQSTRLKGMHVFPEKLEFA